MAARHWIIAGGLALATLVAGLLLTQPETAGGQGPGLPEPALAAYREGRYLRATQLIRQALASARDTAPETILMLARAEAGWGDWRRARGLLDGRQWLERVENGAGLELLGRARLAEGDPVGAAGALEQYLDASRLAERNRGATLVRIGQAYQRAGNEAAALRAYDRAARELASLAPWIGLLAAGAAADGGDSTQVRVRLGALPRDLARDRGWPLAVRAAARAGDTASAVRVAEQAALILPTAAARAAAWQSAGELLARGGNAAGALQAFERALTVAPGSGAGTASARALLRLGAASPEQRFRAGVALLEAGDAVHAAAPIRSYLRSGHVAPVRRNALLLQLGRGLFADGQYRDAITVLRAAGSGAEAGAAAEALYYVARAQNRLSRTRDAHSTLARLVELYPRQGATASALFLLGDIEQDAGRTGSAQANFRRATALPGPRGVVGDAYMRLGEIAFTARAYERALATYQAYLRRYPAGEHVPAATFWIGRALLRLGQAPAGRARLEQLLNDADVSYYTVRAAELLNRPVLPDARAPAPPPGAGGPAPREAADRIELMSALGLEDAVAAETRAAEARFAGSGAALYDFADELNARGFTSAGIRIGWSLRRRTGEWNPRLLRIVYPFPYRATVAAEARARGLDPYLVAGLIHQESNFVAGARSPAGAVGLMQVMPGTGRTLARALGVDRFDADFLQRPELNVYLGAAFVADLLRQTDGNVPQMLAAYNAGPARLHRWRRFPEARDPDLFAERVPFDETRDYVRIVQANARIYAALYPGLAGPA